MTALLSLFNPIRLSASIAAGFGDTQVSSYIDTQNASTVAFIIEFGEISDTGTAVITVRSSPDHATWTNITGLQETVTSTSSNKAVVLQVTNPPARYVDVTVQRETADVAIDSVLAMVGPKSVSGLIQDASIAAQAKYRGIVSAARK